jgi:glycosyltransferase involved in cell wall biosynthesis
LIGGNVRICFLDRSTKLETVNDLQTRPRGGMVTSLFKVSDYLSRQGHTVWVCSDIKESGLTRSSVVWINEFPEVSFDVVVCNRGVGGFDIQAKHRILWTHDLPHAGQIPEPKNIKAFAVVFMSKYAERIWRYYYKDIGRSFYIPNGVDKELFYPREKDLDYLIYASAPNRGLKRLPLIFDSIATRVKRPIYMRAYSNLAKLHPNEVDERDDLAETYSAVKESGVTLCDPIPQSSLAEELGRAGLMILPSSYPEICSNIVLQSLASGVPIVTTGGLGSSEEWISRRNGVLTAWQPHDYMAYTLNVVRESVRILEDPKLHRKLIRNAAKTKIHSWDEIGAQWEKMLHRLM